MGYPHGIRLFLKAVVLHQIFSIAVCVNLTWSCYQETGSCYYVDTVPIKRIEASCLCRSAGGHLVKIDSEVELNLVRQLMANETYVNNHAFYIGATDMRIENEFVWHDGTNASNYIMWRPGEPSNDNGYGHCVVMHNKLWWETDTFLSDFMAFDVPCGQKHNFVCEKGTIYPRFWEIVSRDETYPLQNIGSFSKVSCVECSNLCMLTCSCMSFGCRLGQHDGDCILYKKHYNRINVAPQSSPGYVFYE